jgi:UDP-glucose 4-epimerase
MVVTLRRAGRGVKHFVLSSTAAVYGDPRSVPIDEDHPTAPVNPYGVTKLGTEWMLAAYARAYGLRYAALRYFNAAGADPEAGLGERQATETHLGPSSFWPPSASATT